MDGKRKTSRRRSSTTGETTVSRRQPTDKTKTDLQTGLDPIKRDHHPGDWGFNFVILKPLSAASVHEDNFDLSDLFGEVKLKKNSSPN